MKKKNSVKFGFYLKSEKDFLSTHSNIKFFTKEELNNKPIIFCSFKGLESDSLLNYGDQIISINKDVNSNFYDISMRSSQNFFNLSLVYVIDNKLMEEKKNLEIATDEK